MTWNPDLYARAAAFVPAYGHALIELLDVAPPARLFDVGCGDGVLSAELARRGYAVTGIDASPEMVAAARARGVDAHVLDLSRGLDALGARAEGLRAAFPCAFSNATLHWVPDAEAACATVRSALVPGGRYVAELGGEGNVASVRSALAHALARRGVDAAARDPWLFPSAGRYARALEASGFRVDLIARFERPTVLPGHARDWLHTFAAPFAAGLAEPERAALYEEVCEELARTQRGADGVWTLDYVRLRFVATAV